MLLRWDIENPGQLRPFLSPEPQWNGCAYSESGALPKARALDETGKKREKGQVGDSKAEEKFFKKVTAKEYLCPPGATDDCVGTASATSEAPGSPKPLLSTTGDGASSTASSVDPSPIPSVGASPSKSADDSISASDASESNRKRKGRKGRKGRRSGRGKGSGRN